MPYHTAAAAFTVSHRINAEPLVLLGWSRAILRQVAHPLIAAGIDDHSGFRDKPVAAVRRLRHTVRTMLALSFGDDADREHALERILAIHRRVRGRLPVDIGPFPAGTPYSAEDPGLVRVQVDAEGRSRARARGARASQAPARSSRSPREVEGRAAPRATRQGCAPGRIARR